LQFASAPLDLSRHRYEPELARQLGCRSVGARNKDSLGGRMPLWRIRIRLSDDAHSRSQLDQALAGQRVRDVTFAPQRRDSAEMAGDVVLEIPLDEDLGTLLSALHRISPQVFVSRVDEERPKTGPALTPYRLNGGMTKSAVSSRVPD
jgi:hypothetical protein